MEGWRTHFKLEVSEEANSELKIQVILIPFLFTCYTYFPLPWPRTPYVMFSLLQERIDEHFWRILDQRTHTYGFIMKTKIKGWQLNNSYYNVVTDTSIWYLISSGRAKMLQPNRIPSSSAVWPRPLQSSQHWPLTQALFSYIGIYRSSR